MTNRDVYLAALAILNEDAASCADYESRAPMLLASFVRRTAALDAACRYANGEEGRTAVPTQTALALDDAFPLSVRLAAAAAYDLAAQLIWRENPGFAKVCDEKAASELTRIAQHETPALIHPITVETDDTAL